MKTLDEVIRGLEMCCLSGYCSDPNGDCPYLEHNDCGIKQIKLDSLYYLKQYRDEYNNDKSYDRGYADGYAKAEYDEEVSKRWDESFRASQMPWNRGYCEMGG
ncbi:MAG: hypothetical protein IKF91_03100 [Bacilli bacterium]|nr:hypothetical protein [Bacilli bacterium]